jgi:tight adherence protein B
MTMLHMLSVRPALLAVCLAVFFAGVSPASSQEQPGELRVESLTHNEAQIVDAIVVPPAFIPREALIDEAFSVTEGGRQRQLSVEALPTSNLSIVLVLDTSGSMKGQAIAAAQRAAAMFVTSLPADAQVAVVGFGSSPKLYSPFSSDRSITTAALTQLRVRGETALHDAIIMGSGLLSDPNLPANTRKVMIVLTDGGDTASKATLGAASQSVTKAGVALSAIALTTRESDTAALTLLTSSTGGVVASAVDTNALNSVFEGIVNSVLRRYRLTWTSESVGRTEVVLELRTPGAVQRASRTVEFAVPPTFLRPNNIGSVPPTLPSVRPLVAPIPSSGVKWLYFGLSAGFLSLLLGIGVVLWPRPPRRRLAPELGAQRQAQISGVGTVLVTSMRRFLVRQRRGHRLGALLERAGSTMDAATASVLIGAIAICGMALGLVVGGIVWAAILVTLGLTIPYLLLRRRADKRSELFGQQFESTLQMIINSLKSGYGVSQAIDTVARESLSPTSDEFHRVITETRLGMDQIRALEACANRVQCDELTWVADSMEVNRDVGGNLTEVLTGVEQTIRSRTRLARQVHSLSAEGRFSAQILIAMPFLIMIFQLLTNRSYIGEIFRGSGLILLLLGIWFMTIGYFWIRKIIQIDY